MQKRKIVSLALALFGWLVGLQAQDSTAGTMSLKEAVDIAIKNNYDVKVTELQAERARISWQQARANLLPNLNASVDHSSNAGRSIDPFTNLYSDQKNQYANYFAGSNLTLFNGLSLQNAIRQNSLAYDASNMELQQAKDNLTLQVILAYLQVLNNQDQLAVARNQVEVSRKQVERLEVMDKEGAVQPSLLSDLRGTLANDEVTYINTEATLETSKISLVQLLNIPYSKVMQLVPLTADQMPAKYEADVERIYATAESQLAQIKAVDLREKSAQKGVKVEQGRLWPTVSLYGNITSNYSSTGLTNIYQSTTTVPTGAYVLNGTTKQDVLIDQDNYNTQKIKYFEQLKNNYYTSFGVNVSIPILNYFRQSNAVRLARVNLKNAEATEQTTRIRLKQTVEQSHLNMTSSYARYLKLVEQVKAFSESFRSAEVRFNAGVINSVDYLVTKNNLDRANIALIIARYDYIFRTKILDYLQGQLTL